MLAFVIPLKSAKSSISSQRTSQLFERTLRSVCSQLTNDFRVFVICHEKPAISYTHPNVEYVNVNFAPPEVGASRDLKRFDKNQKLIIGIKCAAESGCSHIMYVDADDCVSRNLASFVKDHPKSNGWVINQGYEYSEGSSVIRLNKKLHNICGTTNIVRSEFLQKLVRNIDLSKLAETLEIPYFLHHRYISDGMINRKTPLEFLPFPGVVYVKDTGENMTGSKTLLVQNVIARPKKLLTVFSVLAYKAFTAQVLMDHIREDFSLYSIC